MLPDKIMQSMLLLGGQFSKLQADLLHFNGTEAVFIGDLAIKNFCERNLVQIQTTIANNNL